MYFFSSICKKQEGGSRINRLTKHGHWKASQSISPILNKHGKEIGAKRPLVYYHNKPTGKGVKTEWLMNEYMLVNHSHNLVLCEIHYKKSKEKNNGNHIVSSNFSFPNPRNNNNNTMTSNLNIFNPTNNSSDRMPSNLNIPNPNQDITLLTDADMLALLNDPQLTFTFEEVFQDDA